MWGLIIAGGFLLEEYLRHAAHSPDARQPYTSGGELQGLPTNAEGSTIPLIFGRCRVRAPVFAWASEAVATTDTPTIYQADTFFNLGIGFTGGSCRLFNVWTGEKAYTFSDTKPCDGSGSHEHPLITCGITGPLPAEVFSGGLIELLDGGSDQILVDSILTSDTNVADHMIAFGIPAAQLPGYRGYISAFLFGGTVGSGVKWSFGDSPSVSPFSFEVRSLPAGFGSGLIGDDVNPVDVCYDILFGTFGKLGRDPTLMDADSWNACAATLADEGHGYSRVFETRMSAKEMLTSIMLQVDGVIFEDSTTGKIKMKLIRADFDPLTIPFIHQGNCEKISNFAMGGQTDLPNKIRLNWTKRGDAYRPGSSVSMSQGNALGQSGETNELQLEHLGINTQELGDQVVSREFAARSRPLMKCQAHVSQQFYRLEPGDPVRLSWPDANLANFVFRVVNITKGSMDDGSIVLDLIQDYNYQWRHLRPAPPPHIGLGDTLGHL